MAPVPIEDRVKRELPCVSNCMLVGDQRRFLAMLITLKVSQSLQPTLITDHTSNPGKVGPLCVGVCVSG